MSVIRNLSFKKYVAIQQNVYTDYFIIIGFSDSVSELVEKIKNRHSYGKKNYQFFVYDTLTDTAQYFINLSLLHLCESAAYAMDIACSHLVNKDKRFIKCASLEGIIKDSQVIFEHSLCISLPYPFDLPAIAVIA